MRSGRDVLNQALRLLNYTDIYGRPDSGNDKELQERGLAVVNQIYADLWHTDKLEHFTPLRFLDEVVLLPQKQLTDVMPYGVAMLIALCEGDNNNQQLYADIYNRKRTAATSSRRRLNVLFRGLKGDCV